MLGQIAGFIAALAFVVLVAFLALPLVKLGKVFDQTSQSIKEITESTLPLIDEAGKSLQSATAQLEKIDVVTTSAAEISQNISALTALYAATLGGPLVKVAAFSYGVRKSLAKGFSRLRGKQTATDPAASAPQAGKS